jgi:phage protein D
MPVTLAQESPRQSGFYVPQFELLVEGTALRADGGDITQVTYHDNILEIDGFELVVNNWDASSRSFKYVGAETSADQAGPHGRFRLFEPCDNKVDLWMGYLGDLRQMLTGRFTTLEPNFPPSGGPTLTVRGVNVLNELRRKQYTTSWTGMRDSEIAQDIAHRSDPATGRRRFNATIRINEHAMADEPRLDYVAQDAQYDIDFLLTRARQRGYVLTVVDHGDPPGLYFGPSPDPQHTAARAVTFQLDWGKSLVDFKPTLTTANQVKSVTVHGWNRRTRQPIAETVSLTDSAFRHNRDIQRYIAVCNPREEIVVNRPVFSAQEARRLATGLLMDSSTQMVKATGTTVGLPDLRAGANVVIGGVGARFSGNYFVTETTHTIGSGGYTTRFNARREELHAP